MPRTENCALCDGLGNLEGLPGNPTCPECGGNGYSTAENDEVAPLLEALDEIDLTATTPPPGRMANQTWRILEEQRQAADDTIAECDAEIERWTNKLVDAVKTKGMCEAGQRALDGGV